MKFYTEYEYETLALCALDNITYNKIFNAFAKIFGAKITGLLFDEYMDKPLKDLSCNSWVDVLSCVTIVNA